MADETGKRPEGRVIAGGPDNIFKSISGGRSDYGGLIISALTGKSQEELVEELSKRDNKLAARFKKDLAERGEVDATLLDAEDQFFQDYLRIGGGPSLLAPPIAPERLERLVSENNAVEPCIAAMTTNISCTGMTIMPMGGTEADLSDEQKKERTGLMDFFKEAAPRKSFLRIRKELRRDLHTTGNSYMVVERTLTGDLAFVRRAPSKSMRLIKLDNAVKVTVKVKRNGKDVELSTVRAERRYVQKVGTKLVYYKEYGSQRDLNRVTGEWARDGERIAPDKRAHEIIHDKDIEDVRSPYGMPRWITQLPSVLGSRMAEEHNLAFFQSGGVPPVIVFVSGGMVSETVAEALNKYLGGSSKDKQRGLAVEVPSSGNIDNEKPANVVVERFGSQEADSTFENYDEKNEARIRRAFRLPGIFLGMSDNYNFACYDAETEALTDAGWITYDQFKPGMKVACYNPDTKALEYHEPAAGVQTYEVEDVPMYHFKGTLMDIMVTPKHRMHYETQYGEARTEPIEAMLAKCSRPRFVRRIPEYKGGLAQSTFTPPHAPAPAMSNVVPDADYPPCIAIADWYELMGWVISEGHALKQGGAISITQHVNRHWPTVKALLSRLEAQGVTVWWPRDETGVVTAYVYDWSIYQWVCRHIGMASHSKRIPAELLAAPREELRTLFNALMAGDGSWDTREGRTSGHYYSTSKSLVDGVQELALKLGYHAYIADAPAGTYGIRPGYRVFLGLGGSRGGEGRLQSAREHERVNYTGTVWCFTVPTGVFVTRRNGKIAVQGNTAHASYVVAEAQVFAPERDEEDERINMTIMREIDPKGAWKIVSNPLSVNDVNLQLKALQMLSTTRGVGVADIVKALSQAAGLEIEISEDHAEDVVGMNGPTLDDNTGDDTEPSGDAPPPGTGNNGPQAANEAEPPSPGVTSTVRNQANALAAKIARNIRDFEDEDDPAYLDTLLELEKQYDDLVPGAQELVDKALGPVMFNSPFLTDATMNEVALGMAKAAFNAARQSKPKEAAE